MRNVTKNKFDGLYDFFFCKMNFLQHISISLSPTTQSIYIIQKKKVMANVNLFIHFKLNFLFLFRRDRETEREGERELKINLLPTNHHH